MSSKIDTPLSLHGISLNDPTQGDGDVCTMCRYLEYSTVCRSGSSSRQSIVHAQRQRYRFCQMWMTFGNFAVMEKRWSLCCAWMDFPNNGCEFAGSAREPASAGRGGVGEALVRLSSPPRDISMCIIGLTAGLRSGARGILGWASPDWACPDCALAIYHDTTNFEF